MLDWYIDDSDNIWFSEGDTYDGECGGGPGTHRFSMGEIVNRRYRKKNGDVHIDEVLL